MDISHDKKGNKIIKVPPIMATKHAGKYQHLHTMTLFELDATEDFSDIRIGTEKNGTKHLILEYKEPLKPNEIFMFSKGLQERMQTDESIEFLQNCQFFYWEDNNRL